MRCQHRWKHCRWKWRRSHCKQWRGWDAPSTRPAWCRRLTICLPLLCLPRRPAFGRLNNALLINESAPCIAVAVSVVRFIILYSVAAYAKLRAAVNAASVTLLHSQFLHQPNKVDGRAMLALEHWARKEAHFRALYRNANISSPLKKAHLKVKVPPLGSRSVPHGCQASDLRKRKRNSLWFDGLKALSRLSFQLL